MYIAKFDKFSFHQIILTKFRKNRTCSISSNHLMKKSQLKLKCEEKITKIKLPMNEHELSFHLNKNSRLKIVRCEFTT